MSFARPLILKDRTVGADKEPLACTPLVGGDEAAVRRELDAVLAKGPDLIEWRVDFFGAIGDSARVVALGREIRAAAGAIPIIFTRRSTREGGTPIALDEDGVFALYDAVARSGAIDLLDVELSSEPRHWQQALELARATSVRMIGSYHNFQRTPPKAELVAKFAAMAAGGADVAKVAVMPQHLRDVLTLLDATLEARETLSVPLISMSMGGYGALSRLFGWMYGSTVSFAVGDKPSAPGQVPIAELNAVVEILQRALAGR
jgi:3-dehydroquinate dehydratase-1